MRKVAISLSFTLIRENNFSEREYLKKFLHGLTILQKDE